jgi:hypothetical protein
MLLLRALELNWLLWLLLRWRFYTLCAGSQHVFLKFSVKVDMIASGDHPHRQQMISNAK